MPNVPGSTSGAVALVLNEICDRRRRAVYYGSWCALFPARAARRLRLRLLLLGLGRRTSSAVEVCTSLSLFVSLSLCRCWGVGENDDDDDADEVHDRGGSLAGFQQRP